MRNIENNLTNLISFINDFNSTNGYLPSVREMANHLNIKSTSTINYYLNILEERNIIKRNSQKNIARAFEILKQPRVNIFGRITPRMIDVPLVGNITAGEPILAIENVEDSFSLPFNLFNNEDLFMLKVNGESMINAGINDGDTIVVHKQNYAVNGEIVVALISESATVKRFYKEPTMIRLQPENPSMQPIYCKEVQILGKVVGLIRKFK